MQYTDSEELYQGATFIRKVYDVFVLKNPSSILLNKTKNLSELNSIAWFVTKRKRIEKHVAQFHFVIHPCHATNVSTYANI